LDQWRSYRAEGRRGDRRRKQGISENEALEKGLKEKSAEFVEKGGEVYAKA
jgi:phosphomethylpyrimidine synthase